MSMIFSILDDGQNNTEFQISLTTNKKEHQKRIGSFKDC